MIQHYYYSFCSWHQSWTHYRLDCFGYVSHGVTFSCLWNLYKSTYFTYIFLKRNDQLTCMFCLKYKLVKRALLFTIDHHSFILNVCVFEPQKSWLMKLLVRFIHQNPMFSWGFTWDTKICFLGESPVLVYVYQHTNCATRRKKNHQCNTPILNNYRGNRYSWPMKSDWGQSM